MPKKTVAKTLSELGEQLYKVRQDIKQKNEELKQLQSEEDEAECALLEALNTQGLDQIKARDTVFFKSVTTRPSITDYEALSAFVIRRKAPWLFERRVAKGAYEEMKEKLGGKPIPGVVEFESTRINARKA